MVLKVYVSNTSGNKEIRKKQQFIKQVLDTKKIEYEEIDISDPACDEQRNFMRANANAKGQPNALPPQVFSDEEYLGDYDEFLESNECDELFEFLKMAPTKAKSEAGITLAEVNGDKDHNVSVKVSDADVEHYDEDKENTES